MSRLIRRVVLMTALVGTVYLVVKVESPEGGGEVVAPTSARSTASERSLSQLEARPDDALALPSRAPFGTDNGSSFAPKSWLVQPPQPAVSAPLPEPIKPSAPPLPYTYVGMIRLADGREVYHLMRPDGVRSVGIGEEFDDQYRLEDRDTNALVIVYLPLAERQYLYFGKE